MVKMILRIRRPITLHAVFKCKRPVYFVAGWSKLTASIYVSSAALLHSLTREDSGRRSWLESGRYLQCFLNRIDGSFVNVSMKHVNCNEWHRIQFSSHSNTKLAIIYRKMAQMSKARFNGGIIMAACKVIQVRTSTLTLKSYLAAIAMYLKLKMTIY